MIERRIGLGLAAIMGISACNLIVGVEDVDVVPSLGGMGGSSSSSSGNTGGNGGNAVCMTPGDCPGMDDACKTRTCTDGLCGVSNAAAGTNCGTGRVCDGSGVCKDDLGTSCTDATNCLSGFCVDGVCCEGACSGSCAACNVPGNMGKCSPLPIGLDDANADKPCLGAHVFCSGQGTCLGEIGAACAMAADCGSNLCNAGVCTGKSGTGTAVDCGPNKDESCHQTRIVPGGLHDRLNDVALPAEISEVSLDRFEVTVGRYRKFLEAYDGADSSKPAPGAGAHPKIPGSGWNPAWPMVANSGDMKSQLLNCDGHTPISWKTDPGAGEFENLPMSCMTWEESFAFCAWEGGRLPTEAEWNYAAVGGSKQRFYPWSDPPGQQTITYDDALYDCAGVLPAGIGMPAANCAIGDILPVGSKSPRGDSDFGHADMAGSMYEWTRDPYLVKASLPVPCVDCIPPTQPGKFDYTFRGGAWNASLYELQNSQRATHVNGTKRHHAVGFRCAYDHHPTCGNGVVDAGEFCDDNSLDPTIREGCKKCDKVKKVVAGDLHACVVTHLGNLKCWGSSEHGQLGQGTSKLFRPPAEFPRVPISGVDDVALSKERTCVLFKNGSIKCFGADLVDGVPQLLGTPTPLMQSIGDDPGELKNLATVALPLPAVALVSGQYHSCALLNDGSVQCWGANGLGELGVGNSLSYQGPAGAVFSPAIKATALATSHQSTCALLADGEAACWGFDVSGDDNGMPIYGVLGLNVMGQLARGDEMGEMNDANLLRVVLPMTALPMGRISGGGNSYCTLQEATKSVRCWGANDRGQLGLGTRIYWGGAQFGTDMTQLPAISLGTGFIPAQVVVGMTHTCVVSTDGRLKCFGSNDHGELGLGLPVSNVAMMNYGIGDESTEMGDALPEVDLGSDRVVQLSLGANLTCALFQNNRVKCWGRNDVGQTGVLENDFAVGDNVLPGMIMAPQRIADIPYVEPF